MGLDFLSSLPVCLLTGAFRLFTFYVNIVMCEFDPAILLLADFLSHYLTHFLSCIFDLCQLVYFFSDWYLFLSVLIGQVWW